jgi:hypothetical protein
METSHLGGGRRTEPFGCMSSNLNNTSNSIVWQTVLGKPSVDFVSVFLSFSAESWFSSPRLARSDKMTHRPLIGSPCILSLSPYPHLGLMVLCNGQAIQSEMNKKHMRHLHNLTMASKTQSLWDCTFFNYVVDQFCFSWKSDSTKEIQDMSHYLCKC